MLVSCILAWAISTGISTVGIFQQKLVRPFVGRIQCSVCGVRAVVTTREPRDRIAPGFGKLGDFEVLSIIFSSMYK